MADSGKFDTGLETVSRKEAMRRTLVLSAMWPPLVAVLIVAAFSPSLRNWITTGRWEK